MIIDLGTKYKCENKLEKTKRNRKDRVTQHETHQ